MGTRCQIDFVVKHGERERRRRIYRHSDGYPDGVIPDLKAFIEWLTSDPMPREFEDIEYTVANFIYWSKSQMKERTTPFGDEGPHGWDKLGYGVCADDIHGDIEYFYEVVCENNTIVAKIYKVPSFGMESIEDFEFLKEEKLK